MILNILIPFDRDIDVDLTLRHILVDTIEERGIGKVINEGTNSEGFHLIIEVSEKYEISKDKIVILMKSLGLTGFSILEIED